MGGGSPSAGPTARSSSSTSPMDASCRAGRGFRQRNVDGIQSRRLATGVRVLRSVVRFTSWRPIPAARSRQLDNPCHGLSPRLEPAVDRICWRPASRTTRSASGTWTPAARRSTLEGDSYNGLVVAFHPDGDLLASRGWSGMLRLWDIRTRQQILSMPSRWLPELRFDRDGSRLSAHSASGRAGILEVSYETECRSLFRQPGPLSSDTTAMAIDRNGRFWPTPVRPGSRSGTYPLGRPWRSCQ